MAKCSVSWKYIACKWLLCYKAHCCSLGKRWFMSFSLKDIQPFAFWHQQSNWSKSGFSYFYKLITTGFCRQQENKLQRKEEVSQEFITPAPRRSQTASGNSLQSLRPGNTGMSAFETPLATPVNVPKLALHRLPATPSGAHLIPFWVQRISGFQGIVNLQDLLHPQHKVVFS